jgi:hypothetical protein
MSSTPRWSLEQGRWSSGKRGLPCSVVVLRSSPASSSSCAAGGGNEGGRGLERRHEEGETSGEWRGSEAGGEDRQRWKTKKGGRVCVTCGPNSW